MKIRLLRKKLSSLKKKPPPNRLQPSRKKRLFFHLASLFIGVALSLLVAEAGARLMGYRPWSVKPADIVVEPGGRFFTPHSTLGYTHLAGEFKITLAGSYVFRASNLENTLRVTRPLDTYSARRAEREVWVMGDSVTYGWSVNDWETYAWLLQEKLPEYEVVNFGVSGYGNIHSLIQLKEALQGGRTTPAVVILAYASWMDVRNTFIRGRRKMLVASKSLGPVNQPYSRLSRDGRLEIFMDTVEYREFPLMRYSALVHAVEEAYNSYEERHAESHEVTKAVLKEIIELCRAHRIELVVAGLTSDATTASIFDYCRGQGVETVDIYVDRLLKENNNLPYDSHPSALAHRRYAEKLEAFLRATILKRG